MSETNHSTSESNSPLGPRGVQRRWAVAAGLLLLLALCLVVWIEFNTWRHVARLKQEFGAANLESFFLGVELRENLLRMNGALLRFQLSENEGERENFNRNSADLTQRIANAKSHLTTADERRLIAEIERAYTDYLAGTQEYLARGARGIRRDTAGQLHQEITRQSERVMALAENLVQAQRAALDQYFTGSQQGLTGLQALLQLSVLLLVVLLICLATLIYRAFVTPLRAQLSESQAVIERQEKLASLGVLAAGVAHEIRNPLTAIKFRLFSLRRSLPESLAEQEDVEVINAEINRLEKIVKDFLHFARPSEPRFTIVPATELLRETRDLLQPELERRRIRLEVDESDAVEIRADREQMQQVLINLIQNAADSVGEDGTIRLRARRGAASLFKNAQPVVTLEVIDTGKGIPAEVERRLFDPFFSTKEGGTGLGLPIAARILEKHGGFLQYSTQVNHGTTFSVIIPTSPPHEGPDRETAAKTAGPLPNA